MNYSRFKAPFLGPEDIERKASAFRRKYWGNKPSPLPIMDILEFELGIQIISQHNLESVCNTSALITADWKRIYIDHAQFMDERYDRRTNFSVSHELGHMVLHKDVYASLEIRSVDDLRRFITQVPEDQYQRLEYQANSFAGKLLVPRDELIREITKCFKQVKAGKLNPDRISFVLSGKFQVSPESIMFRMKNERLIIDDDLMAGFGPTL